MPATNPYQGWFDAVLTALRTCVANAEQVVMWNEEAVDDLAPSERLVAMLSRPRPQILLSWGAGGSDQSLGGFNAGEETMRFSVRFGTGAPQADRYDKAHDSADANYTGAWELYHKILEAVLQVTVSGWQNPPTMENAGQILMETIGKLAVRMDFKIKRVREYA